MYYAYRGQEIDRELARCNGHYLHFIGESWGECFVFVEKCIPLRCVSEEAQALHAQVAE